MNQMKGAVFMKMLILVIVWEVVALGLLFLGCFSKYKHKNWIKEWISYPVVALWIVFAIICRTEFIIFEMMLGLTVFTIFLLLEKRQKGEKIYAAHILILVLQMVCEILTCRISQERWNQNIQISDETMISGTVEEFPIPQGFEPSDTEFVCVQNQKTYTLFYINNYKIYEIESFENLQQVYIMEEGKTPYIQKTETVYFETDYNFQAYEKPTTEPAFTETIWELYVPKGSLKEYCNIKKE